MSVQFQSTNTTLPLNGQATTGQVSGVDSAYRWLVAWIAVIVIASLANRSRVGHVVLYYSLWLMLIFLFVTQYRFIADMLSSLSLPHDSGPAGGGPANENPGGGKTQGA